MTEAEFLAAYNAKDYDQPLFTVDATLFTFHEGALQILLVQRSGHPDLGRWGLPGGFVDTSADRTLEDAALRTLRQKTAVCPPYLEQLESVGNHARDPRGWSITVVYTALIAWQACAPHLDRVADARWVPVTELQPESLAFDHAAIISRARERLRQKALYSLVPAFALPKHFTLPELQSLHESLIGKSLQKKSFRRRIEQADLLEEVGEQRGARGRPAALYRMKPHAAGHTFVRNLEE